MKKSILLPLPLFALLIKFGILLCSICLLPFALQGQPGTLDPSFDGDGLRADNFGRAINRTYAAALQPDGKIVLAGEVVSNDRTQFAVSRLMPDGSPDVSFGKKGFVAMVDYSLLSGQANAVAVLSDGKILVGGATKQYSSGGGYPANFALLRLLPDGSPDPAFGGGDGKTSFDFEGLQNDDVITDLFVLPGGKFAIGGYSYDYPNKKARAVFGQFLQNGQPDTGFGTGGWAASPFLTFAADWYVTSARLPDGRFLAAASFGATVSNTDVRLFRFLENGQPDAAFGTGGAVDFAPTTKPDLFLDLNFQADGKILLAGYQSNPVSFASEMLVARLLPDGLPDPGFSGDGIRIISPTQGDDLAYHISETPGGKILVAGSGSYSTGLVLQLNADGANDLSGSTLFGASPGTAEIDAPAFAVQPDGKLLLAGLVDGEIGVARFMPDLTPDTSFGTADGSEHFSIAGSDDQLRAIALQPDGKILVAGETYEHRRVMLAARYLPDGQLDTGFGQAGSVKLDLGSGEGSWAQDIAVQPDGKILLAGSATFYSSGNDVPKFAIARLMPDGSLDAGFDGDGTVVQSMASATQASYCNAIAVRSDGKIVAGGSGGSFAMMRFLADGKLDPSFGGGTGKQTTVFNSSGTYYGGIEQLAIAPDGKMLAVGEGSLSSPYDPEILLARYLPDGSLDPSFSSDGTDVVTGDGDQFTTCLAAYPDGRFLVGGLTIYNPPAFNFFVELFVRRTLPDGAADPSFGTGGLVKLGDVATGYKTATATAIQPDGKILVAGYGNDSSMLLRLLPDGQVDTGFGADGFVFFNKGGGAQGMAVQPDGKILVDGYFSPIFDSDGFVARVLPGDIIRAAEQNAPEIGLSAAPNPATGVTFLEFGTKEDAPVSAYLADGQGRVVKVVFQKKEMPAGSHRAETDLTGLPAGTYWLVVEAGENARPSAVRLVKL